MIDVPYLDLNDMDGMRAEAEAAAELGFSGKGSIHPKQVPVLNAVFTPSEAEVAYAQKIISAFEQADSGLVEPGRGAARLPLASNAAAMRSMPVGALMRGPGRPARSRPRSAPRPRPPELGAHGGARARSFLLAPCWLRVGYALALCWLCVGCA